MAKASPDQVEVFTAKRPEGAYTEIGVITAQGTLAGTIADVRQKAAEYGCDGVVLIQSSVEVSGNKDHVGSTEIQRFTCILFDAAPEVQSATGTLEASQSETLQNTAPRDKSATTKANDVKSMLAKGENERAEALALGTLEACADRCSEPVLARLWALVGVARARRDDRSGARAAFNLALQEDSSVRPDPEIADTTALSIFQEARTGGW